MEKTYYYKNVTIGGNKYTIFTPGKMSNEEFTDKVNHVRKIFGYTIYPRWLSTRMLLGDTFVMLRKNGLLRHRIKKAANTLSKELGSLERLHMMDFDPDWIEVMSGHVATKLQPKVNALRGALGGLMMQRGVKNYILYSYPQAICILSREGTEYHDTLMRQVKIKFGLDFSDVFAPLRGDKVLWCARQLMSAMEDVMGEKLPIGVDATGTSVEVALESLERAFYNDKLLSNAFAEAQRECEERDFDGDSIADLLSTKYNVKRV